MAVVGSYLTKEATIVTRHASAIPDKEGEEDDDDDLEEDESKDVKAGLHGLLPAVTHSYRWILLCNFNTFSFI